MLLGLALIGLRENLYERETRRRLTHLKQILSILITTRFEYSIKNKGIVCILQVNN